MRAPGLRFVRRSALCLCGVFLFPLGSAEGEEFPLTSAVSHSVPEPLRPTVQKRAQQHADVLYTDLLLRTDEADRVCTLSDAQRTQLELAAKGAVQHAIDDWLGSIAVEYVRDPQGATAQLLTMRIARQSDLVKQDAIQNLGNRRVVVRDLQGIGNGGVARVRGNVIIMEEGEVRLGGIVFQPQQNKGEPSLSIDPKAVSESGIWQSTLDRTLSEAQQAKLTALRTAREKSRTSSNKRTQLELMLIYLDEQLLLDSGQQEQMTKLCRRFLTDRSSSHDGVTLAKIVMNSLSAEELAGLLSKRQQSRWHDMRQKGRPPFDAYRPNVIREFNRPRAAPAAPGF